MVVQHHSQAKKRDPPTTASRRTLINYPNHRHGLSEFASCLAQIGGCGRLVPVAAPCDATGGIVVVFGSGLLDDRNVFLLLLLPLPLDLWYQSRS